MIRKLFNGGLRFKSHKQCTLLIQFQNFNNAKKDLSWWVFNSEKIYRDCCEQSAEFEIQKSFNFLSRH